MSITVIKCINRYGCGLFNSCCGMKIKFFAYVLGLNNLHLLCHEESFDNDFVKLSLFRHKQLENPWYHSTKYLEAKVKVITKVVFKSQGKGKMAEKWLQENVNISPKKTVTYKKVL